MDKIIQPHWWAILRSRKGETSNPNGRPRRGVSLFLHECSKEWIDPVRKQDIEATYLSLIDMTKSELQKVNKDEKQPLIVRKLAQFICDAKDHDIFDKILDRWIGKATQSQNIDIKSQTLNIYTHMSDEQLHNLLNLENDWQKSDTTWVGA